MLEYSIQIKENQVKVLRGGELIDLQSIGDPPQEPACPWEDYRQGMPVNPQPNNPYFVQYNLREWWQRTYEQIERITIHHTLAHDMQALADYFTRSYPGGLGTPTTHYAIWITQEGEARYCVDLHNGCWHDHTGHYNKNVSIGLAGRWDYEPPPQVMIDKTVEVCHYLFRIMPQLGPSNVNGHCDYFNTRCPGWNPAAWRQMFYDALVAYGNPAVSFAVQDYYEPETLFRMLKESGDIDNGEGYFVG